MLHVSARDVADAGGFLYDDTAVFGHSMAYRMPHEDADRRATVEACVAAKTPHDAVDADTWRGVADLAAGCSRLAWLPPTELTVRMSRSLFEAGWAVADVLPLPLPRVGRRPYGAPYDTADAVKWGLATAATALEVALGEPTWTDPDALSGWVTDALLALLAYQVVPRDDTAPGGGRAP